MTFSHDVDRISGRYHRCVLSFLFPPPRLFADLQPGQEDDEQMQRPEVRDEDLAEAKNKLGASTAAKSKTFEVMEECGEDTHTHKHTWKYKI